MSVTNYLSTLSNNAQEQRSHLYHEFTHIIVKCESVLTFKDKVQTALFKDPVCTAL